MKDSAWAEGVCQVRARVRLGSKVVLCSGQVALRCLLTFSKSQPPTFRLLDQAAMLWGTVLGFGLLPGIAAFTSSQLRERSIYQVLTDRFARHDGYQTPCYTEERAYCGGTWKGIEQQLDYIQGMGFDTGECRQRWSCLTRQYGSVPSSQTSLAFRGPRAITVRLSAVEHLLCNR